jgi:hypothetical protein
VDERKRDSIIAYLRSRMAEFGISETALAEALADVPVSVTTAVNAFVAGERERHHAGFQKR